MPDIRSIFNKNNSDLHQNNQSGNEIKSKNSILRNKRNCKLHRNKLYKCHINLLEVK